MQVLGQHHHGIDREGMAGAHVAQGVTQVVDAIGQQREVAAARLTVKK